MTVFAAGLFVVAMLASAWTIAGTLRAYGRKALGLRAELARCSAELQISWERVERGAAEPALFWPEAGARAEGSRAIAFGFGRATRPSRALPALCLAA